MTSSSIVDSAVGHLLAPMPAPATQRKSVATWVEAMPSTALLQLSLRSTQTRANAIMPHLSPLSTDQASCMLEFFHRKRERMKEDPSPDETLIGKGAPGREGSSPPP